MRFKDVPIGSMFSAPLAGMDKVNMRKISETTAEAKKLNRPGYATIEYNPELNQDECTLVEPEQTQPYRPMRSSTEGIMW